MFFILFLKPLSKTCAYFYPVASVFFFLKVQILRKIFLLRQIMPSMNFHQPSMLCTNVPENTYFFSESPATVLSMMSYLDPRCPWRSVDSHSNFSISTLIPSYPPVVLSSHHSQIAFASILAAFFCTSHRGCCGPGYF